METANPIVGGQRELRSGAVRIRGSASSLCPASHMVWTGELHATSWGGGLPDPGPLESVAGWGKEGRWRVAGRHGWLAGEEEEGAWLRRRGR